MSFLKIEGNDYPTNDYRDRKFKEGLAKTRENFTDRVNELVARYRKVDEEFFEELEEILIAADVGFHTVMELIDELKFEVKNGKFKTRQKCKASFPKSLSKFIKRGRRTRQVEYPGRRFDGDSFCRRKRGRKDNNYRQAGTPLQVGRKKSSFGCG